MHVPSSSLDSSGINPLCSTLSDVVITDDTKQTSPSQSAKSLIDNLIYQRVDQLEQDARCIGSDGSFFVADLGEIRRQYDRWMSYLPYIRPFYAVKCNPDPVLLQVLIDLGFGFDCASVEEMRTILRLGAHPNNIIFANPCKSPHSLMFAQNAGIKKTTFDNLDELDSIKKFLPDAQLLLRIFANDISALVALGEKFGAPLETTKELLVRAKEVDLDVIGVSFHIGSGASDPNAIRKSISHARLVWDTAQSLGFSMQILDIGGGFHPTEGAFRPMATALSDEIAEASFPHQTSFIAEPGRFFARSVFTLVCRLISRRRSPSSSSAKALEMLYQNDGVYGNFMNRLIEKEDFAPILIKSIKNAHLPRKDGYHAYKIWGPTCDSTDCVSPKASFPCEVKIDDWLVYRNMGAYTSATATCFNGFSNQTRTIYMDSSVTNDGSERTERKCSSTAKFT